jgi:hypothetical protein
LWIKQQIIKMVILIKKLILLPRILRAEPAEHEVSRLIPAVDRVTGEDMNSHAATKHRSIFAMLRDSVQSIPSTE